MPSKCLNISYRASCPHHATGWRNTTTLPCRLKNFRQLDPHLQLRLQTSIYLFCQQNPPWSWSSISPTRKVSFSSDHCCVTSSTPTYKLIPFMCEQKPLLNKCYLSQKLLVTLPNGQLDWENLTLNTIYAQLSKDKHWRIFWLRPPEGKSN